MVYNIYGATKEVEVQALVCHVLDATNDFQICPGCRKTDPAVDIPNLWRSWWYKFSKAQTNSGFNIRIFLHSFIGYEYNPVIHQKACK